MTTHTICILAALGCLMLADVRAAPYGPGLGRFPGPWVVPTRGEVWPKPQEIINYDEGFMTILLSSFTFRAVRETCGILDEALNRYYRVLTLERDAGLRAAYRPDTTSFSSNELPVARPWEREPTFRGYLDLLEVELMARCEPMPYNGMDEHYELKVDTPDLPGAAKLTSQSVWGILRGLETFVQMVAPSEDGSALHINSSAISDFPRFPYRGLLLDSARHFQPMSTILTILDGMEANKLNTLHWHLADDESFPYQSKAFPELSEKGAYHPFTHVYSRADISEVIEYARFRGIRVVPEFDSPGHVRAWGEGHPEILTVCYDKEGQPDGTLGPMDPTKPETYDFVRTLFTEVATLFPDRYFHLGGDEVNYTCWASNQDILTFMEDQGIPEGQFTKLEELYIQKVIEMTEQMNDTVPIVWQEVFDNGDQFSTDTVVHVWKPGHEEELAKVTAAGYPVLLSSCWYLDHLKNGGDWKDYYTCEPHNFTGTPAQKQQVMGGEACMWAEFVDHHNIIPRIFPRVSAVAERLWSSEQNNNAEVAAPRLEEFRCRMVRRGISAQPAGGPGICAGEVFSR